MPMITLARVLDFMNFPNAYLSRILGFQPNNDSQML